MPRIFDNIDRPLLPALQETLDVAYRADFCVGYFNLRGWRQIDAGVEEWAGGQGYCCRLLVGMHRSPDEELHQAYRFRRDDQDQEMDNQTAARLRTHLAEEFRQQLTLGAPNNQDEAGLRRLARQIREGKLVVKLFLRHPLHAKLYLLYRQDAITPVVGYLGSSNLTFSGLAGQGELNVDVVEQDAAGKLAGWFEDRWNDRWCLDISQELAAIIDESWAGERLLPPYYIYLKMAYHLSREARAGLAEFKIPAQFHGKLFNFQTAAVRIAARHLNRRGGVLIGDVVGLGKTIMATALAKIFEEDFDTEALILCPKNLASMWEAYREDYGLRGRVLSISRVQRELPHLRRYRLVIVDESHNLRNPEGVRYRAIREYIQANDSRCILLTATPYNKTYLDLSSQLGLFVQEVADLGIRPERLLREIGEIEFNRQHQCGLRTLEAFEKSPYADDWRDLMALFMVRRTRTFIQDNYATADPATGRRYLSLEDGTQAYFPERRPRTVRFAIDEGDPDDQYARLYAGDVVDTINSLMLPRYGLGNYKAEEPARPPNAQERRILDDLARGGRRLMGFCRTNLFKRLESSGQSFLLSVERHALRNYIFLHALARNLPLPVGTQGPEMLDPRFEDEDADAVGYTAADLFDDESDEVEAGVQIDDSDIPDLEAAFEQRAAYVYGLYSGAYRRRFRWIRPDLFVPSLAEDLRADARALIAILTSVGSWDPARDAKLGALETLLTQAYPGDKVLVFSQFADTVRYLADNLRTRGVTALAGVTGDSPDPTLQAWRFSPVSNGRREQIAPLDELRVLIATDVLSEGQNLQDCCTVVNYDLPWAIIRLIQRVGRVDRIGQQSPVIDCHTFLPADGVDRIIRLRQRLRDRLRENAEVVGTDEAFFEDDEAQPLVDLYHETAGVLDDEADNEVDLVSYAYQIWKNAIEANPPLERAISRLPNVTYSAKAQAIGPAAPGGVLVFASTGDEQNALVWIDEAGQSVTESQFDILRAAECALDTPAAPRQANHHDLVRQAVERIMVESVTVGGQLGSRMGARFKTYERLMPHANRLRSTLFESLPQTQALFRALDQIYRYPLREGARDRLNRQLRAGVQDEQLAELVVSLYQDDRLCLVQEGGRPAEPAIVCSLGLAPSQ